MVLSTYINVKPNSVKPNTNSVKPNSVNQTDKYLSNGYICDEFGFFNVHKNVNEIKKQTCLDNCFNYVFIIDKKYDDFLSLIKNKSLK